MNFLYLSCSAIMDSLGGRFNKEEYSCCLRFQNNGYNNVNVVSLNMVVEMKLYIRSFSDHS